MGKSVKNKAPSINPLMPWERDKTNVMRFIHEPLAWILRATSILRNDFNKLID